MSHHDRVPQRPKYQRVGRPHCALHASREHRISVAVRSVQRVARKALVPGALVWAWAPFTEEPRGKFRPVAPIAAPCNGTMRALIVTTLCDGKIVVPIDGWREAGLTRPSGFQWRIVDIEVRDCTEVLGTLAIEDHKRLDFLVDRLGSRSSCPIGATAMGTLVT